MNTQRHPSAKTDFDPSAALQDAEREHAKVTAEKIELEEALADRDETIRLCQSYASNTSGGFNAEARLRAIFELCCRARAALEERHA